MKKLTLILLLTCSILNGQSDNYKDWILTQRLPKWSILKFNELKINDWNYQVSNNYDYVVRNLGSYFNAVVGLPFERMNF